MKTIISIILGTILVVSCSNTGNNLNKKPFKKQISIQKNIDTIFFAGGCFWGTEHLFKQIEGVLKTEAGFANGNIKNPTYKDVVTQKTGYAETVKVIYDTTLVKLDLLLDFYFQSIDPTSIDKQGNDFGNQYRTGIFYTSPRQLPIIERKLKLESVRYSQNIVVEVTPLKSYYKAEEYHQDYLNKNPNGYCHINPALFEKAREAKRK